MYSQKENSLLGNLKECLYFYSFFFALHSQTDAAKVQEETDQTETWQTDNITVYVEY